MQKILPKAHRGEGVYMMLMDVDDAVSIVHDVCSVIFVSVLSQRELMCSV